MVVVVVVGVVVVVVVVIGYCSLFRKMHCLVQGGKTTNLL